MQKQVGLKGATFLEACLVDKVMPGCFAHTLQCAADYARRSTTLML
jgi:hypothetical protein